MVATYSYLLYLCAIQRVAPSSKSYFRSLVLQLHQQNEAGFKVPVPQDWEPTSVASEATQALFWRPQALFLRQQELLWRPQTQFWIPQTLFWNAQARAQGRRPSLHQQNEDGFKVPVPQDCSEATGAVLETTGAVLETTEACLETTNTVLEPTDAVLECTCAGPRPKAEGPHYTNKMKTGLRCPCRKTGSPQALRHRRCFGDHRNRFGDHKRCFGAHRRCFSMHMPRPNAEGLRL